MVSVPPQGSGTVSHRPWRATMTTLPDARVNKNLEGPGFRARVQRFGGQLAGMIMPNIGAFIAWGLITAMFIESGWLPNATLAGSSARCSTSCSRS
ncbi:hypothetical protein [Tessaracoccus coleopterorum]|uniref:hypothetical protein n=1 Tax=Tessaracoccus coleopterorum TaxID=2714950 RepID=UPI001E3D876F|nr:hypothetical protein [Tessaracoccus coleopterorum]